MFVFMKKGSRKLMPKFDECQLGSNLFASKENLKVRVVDVYDKDKDKEVSYENDSYCKLFSTPDRRLDVSVLSPSGKSLLIWIMYELDGGKDYFWFNRERYMKECGIKSPTTVTTALKELNNKFIQPSNVREIYFINPHFFFTGSRLIKYKDNIVIVKNR